MWVPRTELRPSGLVAISFTSEPITSQVFRIHVDLTLPPLVPVTPVQTLGREMKKHTILKKAKDWEHNNLAGKDTCSLL